MNAIIEKINSAGSAFVEFAVPMLVQVGVLILILLLVDLVLRRKKRAVFRYWIWMLVLVKLMLPTSLSSPFSLGSLFGDKLASIEINVPSTEAPTEGVLPGSDETLPANLQHIIGVPSIPPIEYPPAAAPIVPAAQVTPAGPVVPPSVSVTPLSWQGIVFLLWAVVVTVMGLLLLQRAMFVRGLVAQAREANDLMNDALEFCRERMGVKSKIRLKVSPNATSPAVCGLFRPVILVPHKLAPTLGARDLRVVLMHELAHIKRGDLWVNLVQTVLQIAYFYNPLLWLANAVIRRIREQAVDEAVLVAMGEKARQYPQTLVNVAKLAFKQPALSLRLIGVVESKSALAGRIKHILNRRTPKTAKLGVLGLLAVIVAGSVLLPMAKAERLTDRARNVMALADHEARRLNHRYIGTEHILLALARQRDGVGPEVLRKLGVHTETLEVEVGKLVKSGPEPVTAAKLPETTRAKSAIDYALEQAEALGRDYVDTEHILLGLMQEKEGIAAQILMNLGLSYDVVRQEVLTLVKPGTTTDAHDIAEENTATKPQFASTLPNGVTVELVGVCDWPHAGKRCWRPDGSKMKEEIYATKWNKTSPNPGEYGFMVKVDEPLDLNFRWMKIEGASSREGSCNVVDSQGNQLKDFEAAISNMEEGKSVTNVRIGVAVGTWKTIAEHNGKRMATKRSPEGNVLFSQAFETDEGVSIVLSDIWRKDSAERIVAIDPAGNIITSHSVGSVASGEIDQFTAKFYGLKLKDIDKFVYQFRPYECVEFKNVSLKPNFKTNVEVQVEVEEAGKASIGAIDVAIEEFKIRPYRAGGLYVVIVAIQNNSNVTAPAFRLNFYRGDPADNLNLHGKPQTGSHGAGPIKPGDVWNEGSMPFALKEGVNEIAVVLDQDNKIAESDETNNRASIKVIVKDGRIIKKSISYSSQKPDVEVEVEPGDEVSKSKGDESGVLTVAADGSAMYSSIQQAIDAASAGAVIRVGPGLYEERLKIDKPLTLAGAGWNRTTIMTKNLAAGMFDEAVRILAERMQAAKSDAERMAIRSEFETEFKEKFGMPTVLVSGAEDVVIRDLKLTSPGRHLEGRSMSVPILKFSGAKALLSGCAVVGTPADGIHILDGSDVEIRNCLVAAVWSTGIAIAGGSAETTKARIIDSDVRNCHHRCITIGRGGGSTVVERCRISGSAWHGVRYDHTSPTITNNLIFGNARFGIYASGTTAATVKQNVFYGNEMAGMSCWFRNQDTIEGNTFADNKRSGLEVLGTSKPIVRKNIFFANPTGVSCGDVGSNSASTKADGVVTLQENLFWKNQTATEKTSLPEGTKLLQVAPLFTNAEKKDFSLRPDSPARKSGIGAAEPIGFESSWPIQPEEAAIIPESDTRDSRKWKQQAPSTPAAASRAQAQEQTGPRRVPSDRPGGPRENNYALEFDGLDDYVKIPGSPSLDVRGSLTLSAWVKSNGDNDGQIIWRGDNQSARDPYELHIDGSKMQFRIDGGLRGSYRISSENLVHDQWYFWTGVYDKKAGKVRLYKDAVLVSSADITGDIGYDTSTMWNMIGAADFGNWQHFKGLIDEAQIWNIARTLEQIQHDMSPSLTGSEPNLAAYWKFDEGSGSTVRDLSGNRNDGQLSTWTARQGYIPVGAKTISTYAERSGAASSQKPLEPIPAAKDLPGELIFHGRYKHRSRGSEYAQPSELWLKQTSEGAVTAVAYMPFRGSTTISFGDRENGLRRYREELTASGEQSGYLVDLEIRDGSAVLTRRGFREDIDGKELAVPEGALFSPTTRPDSYCAANVLLRGFDLKQGQSKEFRVYDWDNAGEALADYTIRVEHAGTESVDVPAGTFEANHIVLTQITSADTWFKKRAGHVTDFWVLDNGVLVRVLRHREPYEIQLLDYTTPGDVLKGLNAAILRAEEYILNKSSKPNGALQRPPTKTDVPVEGGKLSFGAVDFEGYFVDSATGGRALEQLWEDRNKDLRDADEILETVRKGLRRYSGSGNILRWIGNMFIWGKNPQNEKAIELMYHASGSPDRGLYGDAIYFGLSVTKNKTPQILRAMAAVAMKTEDYYNVTGRILWGCRNQKDELIACMEPYFNSDDETVRQKARDVKDYFMDSKAFMAKRAKEHEESVRQEYGDKLVEFKEQLLNGNSQSRMDTLKQLQSKGIMSIVDESFLDAFGACTKDSDPRVRTTAARMMGGKFVWSGESQNKQAIEILTELLDDADHSTRGAAVYYGLSTIRSPDKELVGKMLTTILDGREINYYGRVIWGIRRNKQACVEILKEWMDRSEQDSQRAVKAYEIYEDVSGQQLPEEYAQRFAGEKSNAHEGLVAMCFQAKPASKEELQKQFIECLTGNSQIQKVLEFYIIENRETAVGMFVCDNLADRNAIRQSLMEGAGFQVAGYMHGKIGPTGSGWINSLKEFKKRNEPNRVSVAKPDAQVEVEGR